MTRQERLEVARRHYVVIRAMLVFAIILSLMASVGSLVYVQVSKAREIECIEKWASTFSDAYALRVGASGDRQNALDELVRSIAFDKAKQTAAYTAYITASDAYSKIAVAHPFPPSPKIACK